MTTGPASCACFACRLSVVSADGALPDVCRGCGLIVKETSPQRATVLRVRSLRERNIAPARTVLRVRSLRERNISPARHCVVCSMAFVKETPPLLAEIGAKSVVLGEQGRFIFHVGRRNPKQGRYFFQSIPIAMRHGGHERRVSASASFPWPKQVVAMKVKCSARETCRWWRDTSRPAWSACVESATFFAQRA